MSRIRRAVAVFLLALAVALPVAALPTSDGAPRLWSGLLSGLWDRIVPILGLAERSRAGADPDGLPAPTPPPSELSRRGTREVVRHLVRRCETCLAVAIEGPGPRRVTSTRLLEATGGGLPLSHPRYLLAVRFPAWQHSQHVKQMVLGVLREA